MANASDLYDNHIEGHYRSLVNAICYYTYKDGVIDLNTRAKLLEICMGAIIGDLAAIAGAQDPRFKAMSLYEWEKYYLESFMTRMLPIARRIDTIDELKKNANVT
jgi:hypothetical protein